MTQAAGTWAVRSGRTLPLETRRVSAADWWGPRFILGVLLVWAAGLVVGIERSAFVLTAMGLIAAIAGLRRPVVGLLGIGLLSTLDPITHTLVTTGGLLRYNTLNYLLVGICLLKLPFLIRRLDAQSRLLLIFLGVLITGVLWSPEPYAGIQVCLSVSAVFGLLVFFWRGTLDDHVWQWMGLTNGFLGAAGGFVFYVEGHVLYKVDPNAWSYLPLTALFSIFLVCAGPAVTRRRQRLLAILAIVNCGWVFLSGSRGSILTGLSLLLFVVLKVCGIHLKALLIAGVVLLSLLIVVWGYSTPPQGLVQKDPPPHATAASPVARIGEEAAYAAWRLYDLFDPEVDVRQRTSGRSDLALAGWHLFLQNPVLGTGTGGFSWYWIRIEALKGLSDWKLGIAKPAHSGWIRDLAENGLPGTLLHAGYVASFAVVGWKKRRQRLFLPGLLVTMTLSVAYLSEDFSGEALFFLMAGATVLLHQGGVTRKVLRSRLPISPLTLPSRTANGPFGPWKVGSSI